MFCLLQVYWCLQSSSLLYSCICFPLSSQMVNPFNLSLYSRTIMTDLALNYTFYLAFHRFESVSDVHRLINVELMAHHVRLNAAISRFYVTMMFFFNQTCLLIFGLYFCFILIGFCLIICRHFYNWLTPNGVS